MARFPAHTEAAASFRGNGLSQGRAIHTAETCLLVSGEEKTGRELCMTRLQTSN